MLCLWLVKWLSYRCSMNVTLNINKLPTLRLLIIAAINFGDFFKAITICVVCLRNINSVDFMWLYADLWNKVWYIHIGRTQVNSEKIVQIHSKFPSTKYNSLKNTRWTVWNMLQLPIKWYYKDILSLMLFLIPSLWPVDAILPQQMACIVWGFLWTIRR